MPSVSSVNNLQTAIALAQSKVQQDQAQVQQDSARLEQSQSQLGADQDRLGQTQQQSRQVQQPAVPVGRAIEAAAAPSKPLPPAVAGVISASGTQGPATVGTRINVFA